MITFPVVSVCFLQIIFSYAVPYFENDVLYIFSCASTCVIHRGIPPEVLISISTLSASVNGSPHTSLERASSSCLA